VITNAAETADRATSRARSDAELIAEMTAANGDALAPLFCRYGRLVYRVSVEILHDTGEAEDVTQEVFLEVYRKAHLYDASRGTVRGWLLQYAYHRALRRKAALRRRAAYRGEPLDEVDGVTESRGCQLTPEEGRLILRAGLAQLPERQRTTLELACFEELTLRDVAERLGVSVGCTRHYYYRGLARLQAWACQGSSRTAAPAQTQGATRRRSRAALHGVSSGDGAGVAKCRAPRPCAPRGTRAVPAPPRSPGARAIET